MRHQTPLPPNGPITAATFATQRAGTVFPALSRAASTYLSQEYQNPGYQGLQLMIDVTSVGAAGTLEVFILARDPASGLFLPLPDATTGLSISTISQVVFSIHPALTDDPNVDVSALLPHAFRIGATVGVNAVAFSVGGTFTP